MFKLFYKTFHFEVRPLRPGKCRVTFFNGDMLTKMFAVQERFDGIEDNMKHIEANINAFLEKDKTNGYKPQKDEMILAKFDGTYYRAVCKGNVDGNPNMYNVFFVDYGNSSPTNEEFIKPLGPKLKNEIILHNIYLENMPLEKDISNKVAKLLNHEEGVLIEVVNKIDGIYHALVCGV